MLLQDAPRLAMELCIALRVSHEATESERIIQSMAEYQPAFLCR
jgi:hypothetical protein